MKTCPKCGELLGDTVEACFHCRYSYKDRRVITGEQRKRKQEEKKNQQKLKKEQKEIQLARNPLFEYKVVAVSDLSNGEMNQDEVQEMLSKYSEEGWRLHSVFTNEIGKKPSAGSVIFGMAINETIDQTVLIFERCIKR